MDVNKLILSFLRQCLLLFCFLAMPVLMYAQQKTWALVIGVSSYADETMPQLQFAHRDAQAFTEYLKSPAGGNVPAENIQQLTNEQATLAAIQSGVTWLLQNAGENDMVYFFFSGHGDTENETEYKDGFLLAYNTPRNNYITNAVSVDYLNKRATTLSVKNKAKVVMITDACHSGNLAGARYNGSRFTAEQLQKIKGNEARITSCKPEELSHEDAAWGEGRGVFSYYLINGLRGEAAEKDKNFVSLDDIKNYLAQSLKNDKILKAKEKKQTPVVEGGQGGFVLSTLTAPRVMPAQSAPAPAVQPVIDKPVQLYFFNVMKYYQLNGLFSFNELDELAVDSIPMAMVRMMERFRDDKSPEKYDYLKNQDIDSTLEKFTPERAARLQQKLKTDAAFTKKFMDKMMIAFGDFGQEFINQYLNGDAAEMEKRFYYNASISSYNFLPALFSVAAKLAGATGNDFFKKQLEVKQFYFAGVAARLLMPVRVNYKELLDTAMAYQLKAVEMEPDAPFIQNELGVIYNYKKNYNKAQQYFERAIDLAPEWSVAHTNLAIMYGLQHKPDSGLAEYKKARSLKADYSGAYSAGGALYLSKKNYLLAEENYRRSITLNSRYFLPFEGLADVSVQTTDYAFADSMYFEAEERKKGFKYIPGGFVAGPEFPFPVPAGITECYLDYSKLDTTNVAGRLLMALKYIKGGRNEDAETALKWIINKDEGNPLAFHLLGKIFYKQKRWQEAEELFWQAEKNWLSEEYLKPYIDSILAHTINAKQQCSFKLLFDEKYEKAEDYFYLGRMYELWNHFDDAALQYNKAIKFNPSFIGGYYKLWRLLEMQGKYPDAENIIWQYRKYDTLQTEKYLLSFYGRLIRKFPLDAVWYYKAGGFLYQALKEQGREYVADRYRPNVEEDEVVNLEGSTFKDDMNNWNQWKTEEEEPLRFLPVPDDNDTKYLPGTMEVIFNPDLVLGGFRMAKQVLYNTIPLVQDNEDYLADVCEKLGDVFTWDNRPDSSIAYYNRALHFKQDNASIRMKLVDNNDIIYHYEDALVQLDSLYNRNEINREHQELYAQYLTHAGRYGDAGKAITELVNRYSDSVINIKGLQAKYYLLSGNYKKGIEAYKELNSRNADSNYCYTIARLYSLTNNRAEAFKWLKMATTKGFNYGYVLQYDPAIATLRASPGWKKFYSGINFRKYVSLKK